MSRSRSFRLSLPCLLVASILSILLAAPALAFGASADWSPRLGYVLTTGEVRARLSERLGLTDAQDRELRGVGFDLERAQAAVQRKSDLVVMDDGLTLAQKRERIAGLGYNGTLEAAEQSAALRAASAARMGVAPFLKVVDEIWETDAATHRLETALTAMGLTPQSIVGSFRVYATRFYDEYGTTFGVALPDKYVKFANLGYTRPSGYPAGLYAVSLYWDGIHRGRDKNQSVQVSSPRTVASAKVVDVGPWNTDDNYWNTYTDPNRPRRINSTGIGYHDKATGGGGPDFLASQPHLALGLPESQAAYFQYYGRPNPIPKHTTSWENYWDKARGYGGEWSGADQFGRQVTQPAAIDLTPPCYAAMGMSDNEWIDVVPLWEARLDLVGPITVVKKPYFDHQDLTVSFTVKNMGSLSGTWEHVALSVRTAKGLQKSVDQPSVSLSPGATKTFTFTTTIDTTGTVYAFADCQRAGAWGQVGSQTLTFQVAKRTVARIGGASRYDTAVLMSKAQFAGTAPAVVIATGEDFPDALGGVALAHAESGPLLLVPSDELPTAVAAEIKRLAPKRVFVLGNERAVPAAVTNAVAACAPSATVTRLAGADRYWTAALVAKQVATHTGGKAADGRVIIATGRNFPDALSASPLSAEQQWPILLTAPSALPSATLDALKSLSVTGTVIVGSASSVSAGVASKLPAPIRLSGPDRYTTSGAIADYADANGMGFGYVSLTSGRSFADAVAGGVVTAATHGTMLLTPPDRLADAAAARLAKNRANTHDLTGYGSAAALLPEVLSDALDALR